MMRSQSCAPGRPASARSAGARPWKRRSTVPPVARSITGNAGTTSAAARSTAARERRSDRASGCGLPVTGYGLPFQPLVDGLAGDAELAGDRGLVAGVAGHRLLELLAAGRQRQWRRGGGRELLVDR